MQIRPEEVVSRKRGCQRWSFLGEEGRAGGSNPSQALGLVAVTYTMSCKALSKVS